MSDDKERRAYVEMVHGKLSHEELEARVRAFVTWSTNGYPIQEVLDIVERSLGLARALHRARHKARAAAGEPRDIADVFADYPHWMPESRPWLVELVERAAMGKEIIVELDNDCQTAFDATALKAMTEQEREDNWPTLPTPESPHEMIVDLFAALGITARGV